MMGGGPFILLKAGQSGRKTAKQAEICLAGLPTILSIYAPEDEIALKLVPWLWLGTDSVGYG
jgi:hypothetical protein